MKCSKCQTDNPFDSRFWKECGVNITSAEEAQPPYTKTLITPKDSLQEGNSVGRRITIIAELGRDGMGETIKAKEANRGAQVPAFGVDSYFRANKNGGQI